MLFRIKDPVKGVLCVQVDCGRPEVHDFPLAWIYKRPPHDGIVKTIVEHLESGPFVASKGKVRSRVTDFDGQPMFLFPWKCWPVPAGR